MKIVVSGPAAAYDKAGVPITDTEVLRGIDGLVYDEMVCATHLYEPLDNLGIEGGSLRIAFAPGNGRLQVVTEYRAPRKLTKAELKALVEQTRGQWSDGLGESCFDDYTRKSGVSVSVFPAEYLDDPVRIEQIDDGSRARRVSPLLSAAKTGNTKRLAKLLDSGEDIDSTGQWGHTPLMQAVSGGHVEAVILLISRGANVNHRPREEPTTCLAIAAMHGDLSVLTALLDAGANINERDHRGATPVMWAANRRHIEVLGLLVEREADLNAQDQWQGHTALMYACPTRLDVVEFLLKNGADPNIKSSAGHTASEEALWQASSDRKCEYRLERAESWEAKARLLKEHEMQGARSK